MPDIPRDVIGTWANEDLESYADELARLKAEIEQLREALARITARTRWPNGPKFLSELQLTRQEMAEIAAAALETSWTAQHGNIS